MSRLLRVAACLLFGVVLSGCAQKQQITEVVISESDPSVQALNEAALRIARAAEQAALSSSVGGTGNRATTQEFKIDLKRLPLELREPLLLERGFYGELSAFVSSLADVINYEVVTVGKQPVVPLMVSMSEQRRPVAEWFADAGFQVGSSADVVLNPSIRQIVVKYH